MIERLLFWSLITITVLAPLPLGSNRPWSWSLFALLVGVLVLAWGVAALFGRVPAPFRLRLTWPILLPFGLALAWTVGQTLPFMPAAWQHPMWGVAADVLGRDLQGRVGLDPFAAWTGIMRLLSYAGMFWLALQLGRERKRARHMVVALVAAQGVYALYGLGVQLSGSETILWLRKWAYEDVLTSTFVNRNSYATYVGFGLLAASALLLDTITRAAAQPAVARREQVGRMIAVLLGPGAPILLLVAILVTALALTASRGGFAAAAAGLAVLVLASTRIRAGAVRAGRRMALGLLLLAAAVVLFFSGDLLGERLLGTDLPREERNVVFDTTLKAIGTAPVLGTGMGTFEHVFRSFQPPSVRGNWTRAHNSYLENALELGVPATISLTLAIAICAGISLVGIFRRRRDRVYPILAVSATALAAVHALVDFSLQIPAVALTFAVLLGLGYAQAWPRRDVARPTERAPTASIGARTPRPRPA